MNSSAGFVAEGSAFSGFVRRIQALFLHYPEWWTWFISSFVWTVFIMTAFSNSGEERSSGQLLYCMSAVQEGGQHSQNATQHILKETDVSNGILSIVSNGLIPWMIMVVAMMFPLLKDPIRHVAFSVRRKDRNRGIIGFLIGYTITWTLAGVAFLLIPLLLDLATGNRTPFVNTSITAVLFLLAAILTWLPTRPAIMTKCAQTMPIRIQGWQLHTDSLFYGIKMGANCLRMCWAPMAALILAHHTILLMLIVTVVLIYERYHLPHTSKLPGYAWGIIALVLLGTGMWS